MPKPENLLKMSQAKGKKDWNEDEMSEVQTIPSSENIYIISDKQKVLLRECFKLIFFSALGLFLSLNFRKPQLVMEKFFLWDSTFHEIGKL